jgi:hypothetical protein
MFNQYANNIWPPYKRISSLPSVTGTTFWANFAMLKSCTHKFTLYAGCYASERIGSYNGF